MMKFSTAVARMLAVGLLMASTGAAAAQQAYPNKPIRIIIPYPPGGSTTIMARIIGQKLTENWGQHVIVDNRPGGDTIIGTEALAKSPPDGYSLMLTNMAHVTINLLHNVSFDVIKDFAPVATIGKGELVMLLHPSIPVDNLREFIAYAKSRPGKLNYASGGNGTASHLIAELFNMMAGVNIQHVPYKGTGPVMIDLLGGRVQLAFLFSASGIPHIKSGKLKAFGITGATRLPALPQVPTFTEAGLPNFDMKAWYAVLAPAGTSKAIIDRLSAELAKIQAIPEIKEKLAGQGVEPFISTPDQLAALMKADMAKFANIIKTANIKLEN